MDGMRAVGADNPKILFLRHDPAGSSSLIHQLQQSGCQCQLANSLQEALVLLGKQHFRVVLSEYHASDGSTEDLISRVTGSSASLFFHLDVEIGCWWLPAVVAGRKCWGTSALRPKEFHPVLNALLRQAPSGAARTRLLEPFS